jgi:hypothetical protein
MNSMAQLKQELLAYIESLTLYEVSLFLQHTKHLVESAEYYAKYTPVSVQEAKKEIEDLDDSKILKSLLRIVR